MQDRRPASVADWFGRTLIPLRAGHAGDAAWSGTTLTIRRGASAGTGGAHRAVRRYLGKARAGAACAGSGWLSRAHLQPPPGASPPGTNAEYMRGARPCRTAVCFTRPFRYIRARDRSTRHLGGPRGRRCTHHRASGRVVVSSSPGNGKRRKRGARRALRVRPCAGRAAVPVRIRPRSATRSTFAGGR